MSDLDAHGLLNKARGLGRAVAFRCMRIAERYTLAQALEEERERADELERQLVTLRRALEELAASYTAPKP